MMPLDPNDPEQLRVWACSLAETRGEQIRIVTHLLRYARQDEMSEPDRCFALAALAQLRAEDDGRDEHHDRGALAGFGRTGRMRGSPTLPAH